MARNTPSFTALAEAFFFALALIAAHASPLFAEDDSPAGIAVSVTVKYAQKYMWRGYDVLNGDPAIQPEIYAESSALGIYAGVFSSNAARADCNDQWGTSCKDWDEVDYYAGVLKDLGGESRFAATLDAYYAYFHFHRQKGVNAQEIKLKITQARLLPEIAGAKPALSYWGSYVWPDCCGGKESKWAALSLAYPLAVGPGELKLAADLYWDDGGGGYDSGAGFTAFSAGAKYSYQLKNMTITPAVFHQLRLKTPKTPGLVIEEPWLELSVSASF